MNQERRNKIVELIKTKQAITNEELMQIFNISIETVRRDLTYLQERGYLDKVYGGAVAKKFLNSEPAFANRAKANELEKELIGKYSATLIKENDTVYFDIGTTILSLIKSIDKCVKFNAFASSLHTAMALTQKGCEVFLAGGKLRSGEFSLSGSLAEKYLSNYNIDIAFIGAGGITENGITDFISDEATLRKSIIDNAAKVVLVADYSKFGVRAMCNVCEIKDIDVLITDSKAPKTIIREFEKRNVKVIIVE